MRNRRGLLLFVALLFSRTVLGQDPLQEEKLRGLKGITSVALVFQPNDQLQIANTKELAELIRVALARDVRRIATTDQAENADVWLLLKYITAEGGGYIELSINREVQLNGEDLVATTWDAERLMIGTPTPTHLKETLQTLLTSFATDFLRANP